MCVCVCVFVCVCVCVNKTEASILIKIKLQRVRFPVGELFRTLNICLPGLVCLLASVVV